MATGAPQSGQADKLSDDERLANRLARLYQDLDETIDLLTTRERLGRGVPGLNNDTIESAKRGCLSAAVVAYCRAFMKSYGGEAYAVPMLDLDVVALGSEEWARNTHEAVLEARNKLVAHSDWEYHHTTLIPPGPFRIGTARIFSLPVLETRIDIEAFTRLARELHVQVQLRQRDLDNAVVEGKRAKP